MPDGSQKRTEVVPEVVFLGKLVERVVAGKIRVPKFQRPFVWKQPDLIALLDSVLRGFPIGSILVWDTERKIESGSRIGPIKISSRPEGLIGYLLDGQQRVSTLVGTLRLPGDANSIVDQVDWGVYYDLDERQFVHLRRQEESPGPKYFPVRSLLDTAEFFNACRQIQPDGTPRVARRRLGEADRLANAFRDYQLPLIYIREADLESAVMVFARLNRTGRKMAADEMVSALTYQEGEFHLAERMSAFKSELGKRGFGNLDRVFLLRSVLAALDRDIYAKDWADLMVKPKVREKLPEAFDAAAQGIRLALDLLKDLDVTSDRLLPYGLQLVLLGEFHRIRPMPDAAEIERLKRWFWVTSFNGWFGGVNTTQARRALDEIRGFARGASAEFQVVDLDAPAQPFPDRFDARSARVRAFLLYLASLRPRSLGSRGHLDPGRLLSQLGTDAVGYVWSNPEPKDLVSSPANRMFVDEVHVGQAISALEELDDPLLRELLPTHGFSPDCIDRLRNGDRAGLLGARLEALIVGEREFMAERKVTPPTERTAATIADSDTDDQ